LHEIEAMLKPIEKQTLARSVLDSLLEHIRSGEIPPGQPLPSQHELARMLSVSRPVLREAMQALAAMGVIEIRPGSGCYVRDPSASLEHDSWDDAFSHESAVEVLEARMVVEVELAGLAALRATERDLDEMSGILERLKRTIARGRATAHITSDFHQALARAGHNRPLYRMSQMLAQARLVQGMRVEHALPDVAEHEYDSHRLLLESVKTRNAETARSSMREHLEIAHGWEERIDTLRREIVRPNP
jgi:GntR family transcriptional regulator, transcriptional repressor for pyruvate dehydrogenase complex